MFIKDINSQEGYIHICEGKTEKRMRQHKIEILKHNINIRIIAWDEKRESNDSSYQVVSVLRMQVRSGK